MIIQAVPLNTGDAALLEAMVYGLHEVLSISNIVVACDNIEEVRLKYPEYALVENFDKSKVTLNEQPGLYLRKILRWLHLESVIVKIIPFSWHSHYNKAVKESDLVFLAAGGYFNNIYNNDDRLTIVGKMKKPVFIIGQSIGPFDKGSQVEKRAVSLFRKLSFIATRENISYEWLKAQHCENVVCTQDIAFLLYTKYNIDISNRQYPQKVKSVAMNFRGWKNDTESIIAKAAILCAHLLRNNIAIVFISTCQGHTAYVDDSMIAQKIIACIGSHQNITIDDNSYTPHQLINQYAKYDLYIGMRLHGAILSMISGTPAINIGYEFKSTGIFDQLNCSLSFHYENHIEEWIQHVEAAISNYVIHCNELPDMMNRASLLALQSFVHLKEYLHNDS